jgi:hypothetical protein
MVKSSLSIFNSSACSLLEILPAANFPCKTFCLALFGYADFSRVCKSAFNFLMAAAKSVST